MNNDLISRSALKELIQKCYNQTSTVKSILLLIDNASTVEPYISPKVLNLFAKYVAEHERPQGEWIEQKNYPFCYECNQCGTENTHKANFCEYCGADMRGYAV